PRRPVAARSSQQLLLARSRVLRGAAREPVQLDRRLRRELGALTREPFHVLRSDIVGAQARGGLAEASRQLLETLAAFGWAYGWVVGWAVGWAFGSWC